MQGQGASYDFTIDAQDKAKVLQISANYLITSGTFVPGSSGVASDLTVWIYDVTNATLIQPSSISFLSNSTTLADKFNATFQTSSNSTSYRLIMHVGTVSALAYSLMFDSIAISPSTYVYGTPITDWSSYTPTITGFGTVTGLTAIYRRVGDSLQMRGSFTSGVTTAVSGQISMPVSIDPNKAFGSPHAYGRWWKGVVATANTRKASTLIAANGTTNALFFGNDDYTTAAQMDAGMNATSVASSGDLIKFEVSNLPALGWSSSVQMSDQTDTRIVAAGTYYNIPTGTVTNSYVNNTKFGSVSFDTTGSYNTATGEYIVTAPGQYRVDAELEITGTFAVGGAILLAVCVNGVNQTYGVWTAATAATHIAPVKVSAILSVKSGDKITLNPYSTGTSNSYTGGWGGSHFSISRLSGPSAIAATESVNAIIDLGLATGTLGAAVNLVTFSGTILKNTHGAMTSSSFTCPIAGAYYVSAGLEISHASVAVGNAMAMYIFVDAVAKFTNRLRIGNVSNTIQSPQMGGLVQCNAGQVITIKSFSDGTTPAFANTSSGNYFNVYRVGN